tara:strand:- start:392 stop:634 length:243 start_codon:yes stop_codon:yes gene_type:complete
MVLTSGVSQANNYLLQMSMSPKQRVWQVEKLLAHHYGDGYVYVPRSLHSSVLRDAKRQGYVSEDGFLTRKARSFLAAGNN